MGMKLRTSKFKVRRGKKTKQKPNIVLGKDTWNLALEKHLAIPFSDTDWPTFAEPARQKTEMTFNLFDTDTLLLCLVLALGRVQRALPSSGLLL